MKNFIIVIFLAMLGILLGYIVSQMEKSPSSDHLPYSHNGHEYQIDVDEGTIDIYDGNRYLGNYPYDSLFSVILKDNQ